MSVGWMRGVVMAELPTAGGHTRATVSAGGLVAKRLGRSRAHRAQTWPYLLSARQGLVPTSSALVFGTQVASPIPGDSGAYPCGGTRSLPSLPGCVGVVGGRIA